MIITNKMNLPEALVKSVSVRRHNDPGRLSATTLLNGIKQILLTDRHWDDLSDDVADRFWAIIGTAVHSVLEHEGVNEFTEEFMSYELDGVTVTGRIDNYNMKDGIIADYKSVSVWKVKFHDFSDWHQQGLIYAWLLHKNGFKVERCQFIALIKDHSKRDAKRDFQYPQKPMYVYEFAVTSEGLAEIEAFIKEKIAAYKQYREMPDDGIPPCSPEERWEKPTKYAVKKEGRKTAVRVLDTQDEAEKMSADLGKGHYIETRPGEQVRCQDYCLCCEYCDFYRDHVKAEDDADCQPVASA
jgi:hypothetical protein